MKPRRLSVLVAICVIGGVFRPFDEAHAEFFQLRISTPSALNSRLTVDGYLPGSIGTNLPEPKVLLLVPGYNQSGKAAFFAKDSEWLKFAEGERLILLTPTFQTSPEELARREGYYYSAQWSGAAAEEALRQLSQKFPVDVQRIGLFGISAGAHFGHRFAEWNPDRVRAFAAYSAGWWDPPTDRLAKVPALIMCGEDDGRLNATLAYFQQGNAKQYPWIWRSYKNTGHEDTPPATALAQAFLRHYLRGSDEESVVGDIQTYRTYPLSQIEELPESCRVILPSAAVAAAWAEEK